jgi:hypothetical protein
MRICLEFLAPRVGSAQGSVSIVTAAGSKPAQSPEDLGRRGSSALTLCGGPLGPISLGGPPHGLPVLPDVARERPATVPVYVVVDLQVQFPLIVR